MSCVQVAAGFMVWDRHSDLSDSRNNLTKALYKWPNQVRFFVIPKINRKRYFAFTVNCGFLGEISQIIHMWIFKIHAGILENLHEDFKNPSLYLWILIVVLNTHVWPSTIESPWNLKMMTSYVVKNNADTRCLCALIQIFVCQCYEIPTGLRSPETEPKYLV